MRRISRPARTPTVAWLAVLLAAAAFGCGQTPTELTPLGRAIGDVRGVILDFNGLAPLPGEVLIYEAFAVVSNDTISLGRFNIDASGRPVDGDGQVIERFTSPDQNLAEAIAILITLQTATATGRGAQILQGTLADGVATLRVPSPSGIGSATGSFRVFTPTDGPGTNEASGLWAQDADGGSTLDLPVLTQNFIYESFIFINGVRVIMGRFQDPARADTINRHSGELDAPGVPGEDFLRDPPEGLSFPADLGGARLIVTLEPRLEDTVDPSQLVVLEAILPSGLLGGETITLINRTSEFPTGTAVLF